MLSYFHNYSVYYKPINELHVNKLMNTTRERTQNAGSNIWHSIVTMTQNSWVMLSVQCISEMNILTKFLKYPSKNVEDME